MNLKNSQPLLTVLTKQLEVCRKYLEIQKEMTDALVAGNIRQIDMIVRDEQSFIMKINSLEKQKDVLLEQEQLNGLKISDIISNHLEEEDKESFTQVSNTLITVLIDLRKVNTLNQRLLKERLSVIEHIAIIGENDPVKRV
jgi:hypothetical protein